MKRLGLTLVAALCLAASTFAAGNQPTTAKWEGNINVSKLGKYLKLNSDQSEEVANICDYFSTQMSRATTAKKDKEAFFGALNDLYELILSSSEHTDIVNEKDS